MMDLMSLVTFNCCPDGPNSPSVCSVGKASLHEATAEQKAVVLGHG